MNPETVLIELLERVGAGQGAAILINDAEMKQWPSEAVKAMKAQRIITKAKAADSAMCPGCEEECVMPVITLPAVAGTARFFILCEQRIDTNRVPVTTDHLLQWRCSLELVCGFVADSLGLRRGRWQRNQADMLEIGVVTGKKQVQMVCMETANELNMVVGHAKVALIDLVAYGEGRYSLNQVMVQRLVDSSNTADERYTPSVARRENRKLETREIHDSWKKQFKLLSKKHPDMPDSWIAGKIKKMLIGKNHSVETIRKNMK